MESAEGGQPGDVLPLSMNEITTFRWSFDEDVHHYEQAGYAAIGVWIQKVLDFGEERAVDRLLDSSLAVSNLLWAGGFTGSEGRTHAEAIAEARRILELAAAMHARCVVVYTGARNNHTTRHADRLLRRALDELLPVAERIGVPLALEPMHPCSAMEWTFLTDLESALSLIGDYDSAALKLVYDTFHFPIKAADAALLRDLVPHLAVVHLGDRRLPPSIDQERCPLGSGMVPLSDIVATLTEAGYNGYFDVELMGQEIEATENCRLLERSHAAFREWMAPAERTA